jgi:hypothetical protein
MPSVPALLTQSKLRPQSHLAVASLFLKFGVMIEQHLNLST